MSNFGIAARLAVYEEAIAKYGMRLQLVVAIEELSECQKEICKMLRVDGNNIDHLAEEVADATIMLEQIQYMYGISADVCKYMNEKVQRLADRLHE